MPPNVLPNPAFPDTEMKESNITYDKLRERVEAFVGMKFQTRRHFDILTDLLYTNTKEMVSATTLRRFWGYQEAGSSAPSLNTLNVLSKLVGYANWEDFKARKNSDASSSEMMNGIHALRFSTLEVGCQLQITWNPDRRIMVEYLGNYTFRVLTTENSKLMAKDTFQCMQIIEGQAMCCENLLREGHVAMSYICGKNGGLRYSRQ